MASDRLCVARSTTGLLQYVQFATDDKSDQILVKVAELAAKTAKTMIAPVPAVPVMDIMDKERKVEETKNEVVREAVAVAIGKPGENNFRRNMLDQIKEVLPEVEDIQFPDFSSLSKSVGSECQDNICFRTLKQARLLVKGKFKEGIPIPIPFNAVATVSVVDLGHVGKLRIDRPFLVDQITKLGFTDGVLTSMAFKRPSEGLAVVSLPLDMLDAVLAVPANFFSSALSGIFSDQKTLYEQQKEIAGLQQQIREEKNKNKSASTDTPDTDTNFNLECTSLTNKDK